jgi:pyruvate,water dikinase
VEHILWFDEYDPINESALGGKNASLGRLTIADFPVPAGFAVSATAYRQVIADSGLEGGLAALAAGLDPSDSVKVAEMSAAARALVLGLQPPKWLRSQLCVAYQALSQRCGVAEVPVAVRSSATCEDRPDASFAGEHDTYLWVRGADEVAECMMRCWSSLYTDRALCYRRKNSYREDGIAMSVGVQKMVLPRAAGVAFTLNPWDGDRSQVAIDAAWGLGDTVVSGSVTPDRFLVDKVLGEITRRTISRKTIERRLCDGRIREVEVGSERRDASCLTDKEVRAVARLARRAEKHYGCPQDVEWAIDPQLPGDEQVVLLQSRPETVWSRKARKAQPHSGDTFRSIVGVLLDPNRGRTAT